MKRIKGACRLLCPPLLWRAASALRRLSRAGPVTVPPEWQAVPEGWDYARTHPEVKGWNVGAIAEVYARKWPAFEALTAGTGPLGVAHESDLTTRTDWAAHNTVMVFAYALALACRGRNRVSMLDWGGGIGHYCRLARALAPGVEIEYHCRDVPLLAAQGARLFPDQHFHGDDACFDRTYDFVLASTSLHYSRDWRDTVRRLARATAGRLLVTRLPVSERAPSYVFVQRPYAYGYGTEYLAWCLNRGEFLGGCAACGLEMEREFVIAEQPDIAGAPEPCRFRGYLFTPAAASGERT
jgi:putative methyltransferase (TIGR04325 family)